MRDTAKLGEYGLDNPLDNKRVKPLKVSWWFSMVLGGAAVIGALLLAWFLVQYVVKLLGGFIGGKLGMSIPGLGFQPKPAGSTPPPSSPTIRVWS